MPSNNKQHGFIFEFLPQGQYVKVNAVCTQTGLEVSIVGDKKATQKELERIAGRKLLMMLEKKKPPVLNSNKDKGFLV